MKQILLWIWQAPQHILGLILLLYYGRPKPISWGGYQFYVAQRMPSGISLGNYIILNEWFSLTAVEHEHGHSIQSRYLGPLYLIVIGLPSLLGNIYDRIAHKNWDYKDSCKWYYNQPWEKWADKLGGVVRTY